MKGNVTTLEGLRGKWTIKRDIRATKEKSVELEKDLEERLNLNKGNAKPKVVTSTANEVIQLSKSEPLKRLGNEKKKTRSEGDKSLKEKSKDKSQQH